MKNTVPYKRSNRLLFKKMIEYLFPTMLTMAAAVGVCRAVEKHLGIHLDIKWVNDLYLNGKKICVCYSRNIVEASGDDFITVNGTGESFIAVKANGDFQYTILDCKGVCVNSGKQHIKAVEIFDVPQSGVLQLAMI